MRPAKPCPPKSHAELSREWDRLAKERHRQIATGEDLSFDHVLAPLALQLLENADTRVVLDIGCGTGELTAKVAQVAKAVVGVEASLTSIDVARETCRDEPNVEFVTAPIESAVDSLRHRPITSALASMTVMTTPDLSAFAEAAAELLPRQSKLVTTLTHPCYWPRYWDYEGEPWFHYNSEIFIEAPFAISRSRTSVTTTHIHRSLERYVKVFEGAGFHLEALVEPMPAPTAEALYPKPWAFPRFLGIRWTKMY